MIFQTQQMLFFSLNENLVRSFERYIRLTCREYIEGKYFKLFRETDHSIKSPSPLSFYHLAELMFFLEKLDVLELANLILLVDLNKEDEKLPNAIEEIILLYPEIKIAFITLTDNWAQYFADTNSKDNGKTTSFDIIKIQFIHSLNPLLKDELNLLITGRFNLFDASNLRCYMKGKVYKSLKLQTNNYESLQSSRAGNFAIVVDEERNQTYFNSYALYRYGFRVLPIISFNNLWYARQNKSIINFGKNLLLRDYDLQFEDYDDIGNKDNKECFKLENILYYLRGLQLNNNHWEEKKEFWEKFSDFKIWFISRLFDIEDRDRSTDGKSPILDKNLTDENEIVLTEDKRFAYLRGINKPVDGFDEICEIQLVRDSYNELRNNNKNYMDIRREDDDSHSISPKILHIGESLLARSKKYFENKMYIVSAVLAQEALEVLNGFHFLVMLNALYQKAVAETYIETEFIGIKNIGKGAQKRFKEIKNEAERICRGNKEALRNVLSQIFADIRHIYREKEQFEAADEAHKEFISVNYKFKLGIKKNNETKKN